MKIKIQVKNLNFNISSAQLTVLMKCIQKLAAFSSSQKKLNTRPTASVAEKPGFWLNYLVVS